MGHDLPRTPLISGQWNQIFAACGNAAPPRRPIPRPSMQWRTALGGTAAAAIASVVILGAAILPAKAQCSPAYMASPTAIKTGAP